MAEERKEESREAMEALREKREALRQRRIRTSDIALLGQIERELYEVEEQLVSKARKSLSGCRSLWPSPLWSGSTGELEEEEASRELLTLLNLQGSTADSLCCGTNRTESRTEKKTCGDRSTDRIFILFSIESNLFGSNQFAP